MSQMRDTPLVTRTRLSTNMSGAFSFNSANGFLDFFYFFLLTKKIEFAIYMEMLGAVSNICDGNLGNKLTHGVDKFICWLYFQVSQSVFEP